MAKLIRITTVPLSLDKLLGDQLKFMANYFDVTAVSSDEKKLKEVAAKYGVSHYHVEMTRQITPLKDLRALWKLYRFLKREKPAIVHTHTPKAGIIGMLAARLAQVPHRLHTVAGMPLMETGGLKRKILDLVEIVTYKAATKVYPNSHGLYDFIVENKYTAEHKLKVIGSGSSNGININYFSHEQIGADQTVALKKNLKISVSDFVFIFVGRLVGHKGVNELVEAFKGLSASLAVNDYGDSANEGVKKKQRVKLLLLGPLEPDLDALNTDTLAEVEKHPDIISVGYQQDVRPYLALSNALVLPSYREGFPNVVLQAGAMELPAIVSNINGCNEIITHHHNGLIVPVKDSIALRHAMTQLFTDPILFSRLKQAARPQIIEHYKQEEIWQGLLSEYREHLQNDLPAS